MAVAPYRSGQALGWTPAGATVSTFALSTAGNAAWFGLSFVPDSARTLSTVRAYISAVGGTLAGSDVTCDLYDSTGTSGGPGASIETGKTPTATPSAAGYYDWTGFTTVLTAAKQYWLVWKNANGTPGTNFPTFRYLSTFLTSMVAQTGSSVATENWGSATSTNSGSTWTRTSAATNLRVGYSDGSYDGILANNSASAGVSFGVYSTRECGVKFTSPANSVMNVRGVAFLINGVTGSPTGSPRIGLWTGGASPTNQGYALLQIANTISNSWMYGYFASNVVIQPSTSVRVTLGESTQSDASTNRYNAMELAGDTDANSLILLPWNGTCTKTYFDGSSWSDAALGTSLFGHALLLDTAGEFGGGAVVTSPFPGGVW